MPFCISILTSVRRIVKIAVRFLHTKTALCDRKDTQSRFAVNAARSIVCWDTKNIYPQSSLSMFQCRTQHCVLGPTFPNAPITGQMRFNAARSIVCVGTSKEIRILVDAAVSMPHAALCVLGLRTIRGFPHEEKVSMPHAALCVLGPAKRSASSLMPQFQCRTQHCMCRDNHEEGFGYVCLLFQCRTQHCVLGLRTIGGFPHEEKVSMPHAALCVSRPISRLCRKRTVRCFNAARSIVCVETPTLALRRP